MAVYTVRAPDGKLIKIQGPDGASEQEVIEQAQLLYQPASTPTQPAPQAQPAVPEETGLTNILHQTADVPLQVGKGAVTGVRMIADAFGANSGVSQALTGVEDYLGNLMSAQSKNDAKRVSEIMKEAEDKGLGAQLAAGLKALTVAPVDLVSNALGTSAPIIAGSLLAMAGAPVSVGATAAGALTGIGLGAATGAGSVKSSIYSTVKDELINAGIPKDKAEAAAEQAQAYGGKNLDQILAGTVLGGVAGVTGVEAALVKGLASKLAGKVAALEVAETAAEQVPKSFARRAATSAAEEAVTEAPQEGQEQLAQNLALQREGLDVPTWRGVTGAATLGGALGALTGGLAGSITGSEAAPETEVEDTTIPGNAPPIPEGVIGSKSFNAKVLAYQNAGLTPDEAFNRAVVDLQEGAANAGPEQTDVGKAGKPRTRGRKPSVPPVVGEGVDEGNAPAATGTGAGGVGTPSGTAQPSGGGEVGEQGALSPRVEPDIGYNQASRPKDASWLKDKQKTAEEAVQRKGNIGVSGPITADTKTVYVDPAELAKIPGGMNEQPGPGNPKYDALLESMSKKGFDPEESGPLLVGVNHRGEPYILEGNNRAAVARDLGIKSVPVQFRWYAGGEDAGGFGPKDVSALVAKNEPAPIEPAAVEPIKPVEPPAPVEPAAVEPIKPVEAAPAAPVAGAPEGLPPLPVPVNKPLPPQINIAKGLAYKKSGDVAYQNGSYGLVRAYTNAGQPVYYTFDKGKLSDSHLDSPEYNPGAFSFDQMMELIKARDAIEAHDKARQDIEGPSIDYNADGVSFSDYFTKPSASSGTNVPNEIRNVATGWKKMFLPGAKIHIVAAEDLNEDTAGKFTGRYRAINALKVDRAYGAARSLGNNEYVIMLNTKVASTAKRLETLAHELGHVHERHTFDNAAPEEKSAIRAEYDKWYKKNKTSYASDVAKNLRPRKGGKYFVNENPNAYIGHFVGEARDYWLGFPEWYADQVSRWATTNAKPLTVVEKFFARLGAAMRSFYQSIKAQGYLPNQTFAQYMDRVSKELDLTPVEEPAAAAAPAPIPAPAPVVKPATKVTRKKFTPEEQGAYDALMNDVAEARKTNKISIDHFSKLKAALTTTPEKRKSVEDLRKMLADLKEEHFNRVEFEKAPAVVQESVVAAEKKKAKVTKLNRAIARSHDASDMNNKVGGLWKNTRSFSDALLLLKATFKSLNTESIRKLLPTLTTDDITRWVGDKIPGIKEVNGYIRNMATMRSRMIRELAEKVPELVEFMKKSKEAGRLLADVMHNATLIGFDPSAYTSLAGALNGDKELVELRANNARQSDINRRSREVTELWNRWQKLGTFDKGKGHALYTMVKNEYQKTFDLHQQILQDKIDNMQLSKAAKTKLWAQITKNFQAANQIGVYFPLMRYGNYWFRVGKGTGSEYYMFESPVARNYAMAKRQQELKAAGEDKEIVHGDNRADLRNEVIESSKMLKDILNTLDAGSITDLEEVKDQVYQMYLMTLPDRDIRTRFAKRKGRIGFGADIVRNFVVAQHTAANQLSRLKYADKIRTAISSSRDMVKEQEDAEKLDAFITEIAKRADAELSPPGMEGFNWNKLAAFGNKAVFYFMLTSPKSAIVQMTQLPIVGLPYLASKYGTAATLRMASRYGNLFKTMGIEGPVMGSDGKPKLDADGNPIMKWGQPSIDKSDYINKHPDAAMRKALKEAWNYANDQDIFMSTYASDMTARARQSTEAYEGPINSATRFVGNLMSGSFHHMERITREIMYMSAFELAYNKLKSDVKEGKITAEDAQTKAQDVAMDAVYDSLFNYTQYNKPRVMKMNAITKIASQFMTFPAQMTSFLVRNFYSMLPYLNKEGKREAAIKFFGTIGMTYMFAGVVGLPGYSMIMGLAQGMRDALRPPDSDDWDEDDEGNPLGKRDLNLWFRETFIPEYFGEGSSLAKAMNLSEEQAQLLQRMVKLGPVSAISGLDIGSSVSLDGLFFRDDEKTENSKEAYQQFLLSHAFGPLGSMGAQIAAGFDDFEDGQFNRGVEKILPAFFRGGAKALRFASEGNLTPQGMEVKNAEWYTTGRLLAQTIGFGSTEVTEIQKANFLAKKLVGDIELKRTKLLERLDLAYQRVENNPTEANEAAFDEVMDMIDEYNNINYILPITGETISSSLAGKAENRARSLNGLSVNKRFAPYIQDIIEKSRSPE